MDNKFDFEQCDNPIPAHRHKNGGGWVAETAQVADTVYVGPMAVVYGRANIKGNTLKT